MNLRGNYLGTGVLLWIFLLLFPSAPWADQPFAKGLLFRIEFVGAEPSYLFGTIHSEDKRVLALPAAVKEAFESTERVAVEVKPDPSIAVQTMIAMVYSDGRNLQMVVGDELYARSVEAVAGLGIPEVAVRQFKPWAVATLLSVPPAETGLFLDFFLAKQAESAGREVIGLETVEEQLGVFDNMSDGDQVAILEDTLNYLDQMPALFVQLLDTYLQGDLQGLMDINTKSMGSTDQMLTQRIQEGMVDSRNQRMVLRLVKHMQQGSLFAAVGALHLPGEKGMLQLLVDMGARVERVY